MNLSTDEIAHFRKRIEVYSLSEDFIHNEALPEDILSIFKKLDLSIHTDSPYALENTFLVALDLLEGLTKQQ